MESADVFPHNERENSRPQGSTNSKLKQGTAVAEFNFGQESKPLLSLDYVPDGLPGKTPSKIGSIQSRCNELKARTKETWTGSTNSKLEQRRNSQLALSDITDWPGIEAVARSSNKGETVDSGTLNIPDWRRLAKNRSRC
ncbi:unnamed protein product [Rodentolepis nana]|uniref:Uncharacterized protein n=1 Tax=Rodentolepis nana TaxID=102285 RepID=A0A0R3TF13_RODNA|nr:unnamed protein product [Rodentolepis nana]